MMKQIANALRVATEKDGTHQTYRLPPSSGGGKAKTAQYALVVNARSSVNCKLALDLYHGPTPHLFALHTAVLTSAQVGTPPEVRIGDADADTILCEYLQVRISVEDNNTNVEEWAVVDVYEMLKPF